MQNLEVKAYYKQNFVPQNLDDLYYDTLIQTDTYFSVPGKRLKIREEVSLVKNRTYAILYDRPNTSEEKISNYDFYEITNYNQFLKVFGPALKQEIVVEKKRVLYLYKNARIHIDTVAHLGSFVEIEIVIKTKEDEDNSHELMKYLCDILDINDSNKIAVGYRELLMEKQRASDGTNTKKDLAYYVSENKVFWVVNKNIYCKTDQKLIFKSNDVVPCIFVERNNDSHVMLQLDSSIKFDDFKYTAWRKFIGQLYSLYVDVLLIKDNTLYDLDGTNVDFENIEKSHITISKDHLAKFALQN